MQLLTAVHAGPLTTNPELHPQVIVPGPVKVHICEQPPFAIAQLLMEMQDAFNFMYPLLQEQWKLDGPS